MASVLVEEEQLLRALSFCRTLLGLILVGNGALLGLWLSVVFVVWSSGEDVQQPGGHCSYIISMVRKVLRHFRRARCIIVA
jgi:hypothetical protein